MVGPRIGQFRPWMTRTRKRRKGGRGKKTSMARNVSVISAVLLGSGPCITMPMPLDLRVCVGLGAKSPESRACHRVLLRRRGKLLSGVCTFRPHGRAAYPVHPYLASARASVFVGYLVHRQLMGKSSRRWRPIRNHQPCRQRPPLPDLLG